MTNAPQDVGFPSHDTPADYEDITPEMMEAGVDRLSRFATAGEPTENLERAVEEIFLAMVKACRASKLFSH